MKQQPFGDCIGGWKVHEAPALWGLYRRLECPEAALEAGRGGQRSMRGLISFSKISLAMIL